jgi:hypothetical protein
VLAATIIRAMSSSETSVNYCQTARRSIPEDSHLQISRVFEKRVLGEYFDLRQRK